jgi:hypothetical protein
MDLRIKNDYFPPRYDLIGFCNLDGVYAARYNWIFKNSVIQEERSIFWEVVMSAFVGRKPI